LVSRFWPACLVVLILLGAGFPEMWMIQFLTLSDAKVPRAMVEASGETISYAGIGPTAISLSWTESTDFTFTSYALRESTASPVGPWSVVANIFDKANTTYYFAGLAPGGTEWWEIVYQNTTGSRETIPPLQSTQPPVAFLTVSQTTSTSAQLVWDNNAGYGGHLAFASYQLMESANEGASSLETDISDVAQHSYTVSDLLASTSYSFYLITTDQCTGCAASFPSPSSSNTVSIQTPGPLTGAISAATNSVEVGEPASFTCAAGGGVPPYAYSWTFGDGATGDGAILSHTYGTPGGVAISCTATDALGTIAKASMDVTVGSDPSIIAFTVSPDSLLPGDKVTFNVLVSGGYGGLSYSYTNLPSGCLSTNSTSLSCYPTSSGNYRVTVTVTDRAMESANATTIITVGPQRVLGLPQAMGLAIIFGAIVGTSAVVILSVVLTLRRRRGRQAPFTA